MPVGVAAAATLIFTMALATVGTIVQANPLPPACEVGLCENGPPTAAPPGGWEDTFADALRRTERGLQQMAGLHPVR